MCEGCGGDKFKHMIIKLNQSQCVVIANDLKNKEWMVQSFNDEDVSDDILQYLYEQGCEFVDYAESKEFHNGLGVIVRVPFQPEHYR